MKTIIADLQAFSQKFDLVEKQKEEFERQFRNEKRINYSQSEDMIRYGNELQKVNLENKGLYVHVESLNSTLENFQQTLQASEEDNERMRQQIKNKNKFY